MTLFTVESTFASAGLRPTPKQAISKTFHSQRFVGVMPYTRRVRPDGTVRIFLRDGKGRRLGSITVETAQGAKLLPGHSYTLDVHQ